MVITFEIDQLEYSNCFKMFRSVKFIFQQESFDVLPTEFLVSAKNRFYVIFAQAYSVIASRPTGTIFSKRKVLFIFEKNG